MAFAATARDSVVAEMNITPLVDVMLVLLVIFMVSAPMLTRSVDATLPQPSPVPPDTLQLNVLQLEVADAGSYQLDGRPLSSDELWRRLDDAVVSDPRTVLRVHASSGADYQEVVAAMAEARNRGIADIGIQH
jgi:biopolymer transport protein ExbD